MPEIRKMKGLFRKTEGTHRQGTEQEGKIPVKTVRERRLPIKKKKEWMLPVKAARKANGLRKRTPERPPERAGKHPVNNSLRKDI